MEHDILNTTIEKSCINDISKTQNIVNKYYIDVNVQGNGKEKQKF